MLFARVSNPHTTASPLLGGRKQVRIFIIVLLPAPFGPRKPTTSPPPISKETSLSARCEP